MSDLTPETSVADRTDPSLGLDPLSRMAESDTDLSEAEFQDRWASILGNYEGPELTDEADPTPVEQDADPDLDPVPPAAEVEDPSTSGGDGVAAASPGVLEDLGVDAETAASLVRWYQGLTPEQIASIDATLASPEAQTAASGYGTPASAPAGAGGVPAAVGQPGVPILPDPPDLGELGTAFPQLQQYLGSVQQTLAEAQASQALMQAEMQRQAAAEAARYRAQVDAELAAGQASFAEKYPQFAAEVAAIEQRAASLQVMPALHAKHGRADLAYVEAMETALWSDPSLRDRIVQARLDDYAASQQAAAEKRGRAAALSAGGGSVSREPAAAPAPQTRDERSKAMAEELSRMIASRS